MSISSLPPTLKAHRQFLQKKGYTPARPSKTAVAWDSAEALRFQQDNPFSHMGENLLSLRRRFLPRLVQKGLDTPHTTAGASELDSPGKLATLLLFFDRVILDSCPICLTPTQLHNLSLLMGRGLAIPKLVYPFSFFQQPVVDFLSGHQDEIISSHADLAYSIPASYGSWDEAHQREHVEALRIGRLIPQAPLRYREHLRDIRDNMKFTPSTYGEQLVRTLRTAIRKNDHSTISKCILQSSAASNVEEERIYTTTPVARLDDYSPYYDQITHLFPNVEIIYREALEFTARGLQVAWSPDLPLDQYLDVVATYRGRLKRWIPRSPDPISGMSSATNTVSKLNSELEQISASKRYRWGRIPLQIARTPQFIGLLLTLATGHSLDSLLPIFSKPSGTQQMTRYARREPTSSERLMAKLFSKEVPMIQLWGIRGELSARRKGLKTDTTR